VEAFIAGWAGDQAAATVVAVARQVREQDVDSSGPVPTLRRGVAEDRRISVEDGQMRHGRKSRSVLFDGYKRHVLTDLDTGLVTAVGITAANAPEASVSSDITADLDAAGRTLAELHIDRAYLSLSLIRDRGPDLAIFCKAWRIRNTGGRYAKGQFAIDFAAGQLTCPAGVSIGFRPGQTVHFPKDSCAACPLRQRCTTSSNGRSVSIHTDCRRWSGGGPGTESPNRNSGLRKTWAMPAIPQPDPVCPAQPQTCRATAALCFPSRLVWARGAVLRGAWPSLAPGVRRARRSRTGQVRRSPGARW
jgi:hypothetical protein